MSNVNEEAVTKVVVEVIELLNKHQLNVPELILAYGNLGYNLGATLAGIGGQPKPELELLQKTYQEDPTIDVALMLQGLSVITWEEQYASNPALSKLGKIEQ